MRQSNCWKLAPGWHFAQSMFEWFPDWIGKYGSWDCEVSAVFGGYCADQLDESLLHPPVSSASAHPQRATFLIPADGFVIALSRAGVPV